MNKPFLLTFISSLVILTSCSNSNAVNNVDFNNVLISSMSTVKDISSVDVLEKNDTNDAILYKNTYPSLVYDYHNVTNKELIHYSNNQFAINNEISITKKTNDVISESYYYQGMNYYLSSKDDNIYDLCFYESINSNNIISSDSKVKTASFTNKENIDNDMNLLFLNNIMGKEYFYIAYDCFSFSHNIITASLRSVSSTTVDNRLTGEANSITRISDHYVYLKIECNNSIYRIASIGVKDSIYYASNYFNEAIASTNPISCKETTYNYKYDALTTNNSNYEYPPTDYGSLAMVLTKFNTDSSYNSYLYLGLADITNNEKNHDPSFTGTKYCGFMEITDDNLYYAFSTYYLISRASPIYEMWGYSSINQDSIFNETIKDSNVYGHRFFNASKGTYSIIATFNQIGEISNLIVTHIC